MGRSRVNASSIPQQDDFYSSSPTLSQLSNPSNDQLPGIDLSVDFDSPALVAREIGVTSNHLLMEEESRTIFSRVLDLDDRDRLVSLSPPVQPSVLQLRKDMMEEENLNDSCLGHTRSPVLARESTALESFSRSIRNYVPSSISIPNVMPSPPRVSRPVSFGMMAAAPPLNAAISRTTSASTDDNFMRQGGGNSPRWDNAYGQGIVNLDDPVFEEEPELQSSPRSSGRGGLTSYPKTDEDDEILWSGWDVIGNGSGSQRLLFLGYRSGLQVWDCTNLGSVCEIVNISAGDGWGKVTFAGVLPTPIPNTDKGLASKQPLIGVVSSVEEPQLIVYSLRTHEVVKKISITGLVSFSATNRFLVVSTATPELHLFSASTLALLFTISSTSLVSFAHFTPSLSSSIYNNNNSIHTPVATTSLDYENMTTTHHQPQPIYALSGRFLAFASPAPRSDPAITEPRSLIHTFGGTGGIIGGMTQSDIGSVAMRVGGSVFSGMKALGGAALHAARTKAMGDPPPQPTSPTRVRTSSGGGLSNLFFSKSAPPASGAGHDRRQSYSSSGRDRRSLGETVLPPSPMTTTTMNSVLTALPTLTVASGLGTGLGSYVTVVDLMPLVGYTSASSPPIQPEKIAEFLTFKSQPISYLSFSSDGTNLLVVPKDGQIGKVFSIRPTPKPMRRILTVNQQQRQQRSTAFVEAKMPKNSGSNYAEELRSLSQAGLHPGEEFPWHLYDLRRGRTNAVIESVDWADDRRWIAIGSRKRTVHVFAVNPYGGKADDASHLEGKVKNFFEVPLLPTDAPPIIRLRDFKSPSSLDNHCAPISFTFIKSTESTLPMNLLPSATPLGAVVSSTSPTSTHHSSPASQPKPLSPTRPQRPSSFQDMLCFDPLEGILSLRRINIDRAPRDRTLSVSNAVSVIGGASISLPVSSASVGWLSASPPALSNTSGRKTTTTSGLAKMLDRPSDLVARENVIATWHLRRGVNWAQVKQPVRGSDRVRENNAERFGKADWISQAELSTSSCLPSVRPRSIYLWHQFSFYALGEDYHALIRSYKLDIPATKIEVRKEVEVSAYSTGVGESFVDGGASPMDIRRVPSSFDEPLASAMSASLGEYANPFPPVLPMLPNGVPGSRFRNPIPIRNVAAGISDGMTEGLGRLKREISRVRSPKLNPQGASGPGGGLHTWAPLEFDEEDEDFLLAGEKKSNPVGDDRADSMSRSTSRDALSVVTPASTQPDFFEDMQQEYRGSVLEEDRGWSMEDRQAIEEAERFYDISPVGFMDEEQTAPVAQVATKNNKGKEKKGAAAEADNQMIQ